MTGFDTAVDHFFFNSWHLTLCICTSGLSQPHFKMVDAICSYTQRYADQHCENDGSSHVLNKQSVLLPKHLTNTVCSWIISAISVLTWLLVKAAWLLATTHRVFS